MAKSTKQVRIFGYYSLPSAEPIYCRHFGPKAEGTDFEPMRSIVQVAREGCFYVVSGFVPKGQESAWETIGFFTGREDAIEAAVDWRMLQEVGLPSPAPATSEPTQEAVHQ